MQFCFNFRWLMSALMIINVYICDVLIIGNNIGGISIKDRKVVKLFIEKSLILDIIDVI